MKTLLKQAGYEYDEETFEKVFRRIYASFGSAAPYTVFPDSQPFLRWARGKGLTVGIISNAEYRYKDVILPALGINEVKFVFLKFSVIIEFIICFLICHKTIYISQICTQI